MSLILNSLKRRSRRRKWNNGMSKAEQLQEDVTQTLVEFAIEMRKRTTDQLAKVMPAEFGQVDYSYAVRRRVS